jgi:hypothetical protein
MKKLRKWQVAVLAIMGALSVAAGSWYIYQRTAPPMPQTVQEAMETFKSDRFKRLPESRAQAYYDRSRELYEKLDRDQRKQMRETYRDDPEARKVMRQAMMNFMLQRARDFASATPEQRDVILDGLIALQSMRRGSQGSRRGERRPRPEGRSNETDQQRQGRRDQRRNDRRQFMQDRIEQGNPQHQAYASEFFKALNQRLAEKGLEPFNFRGRGRGR